MNREDDFNFIVMYLPFLGEKNGSLLKFMWLFSVGLDKGIVRVIIKLDIC